MSRLLFILFVLCFAGDGAVAQCQQLPNRRKAFQQAAEESGSPLTYLLQENYEGTGYENAWTPVVYNATFDPDYTGTVLEGEQSLQLTATDGWGRSRSTNFVGATEMWAYMLFRPTSLPDSATFAFEFYEGATFLGGFTVLASGKLEIYQSFGTSAQTTGVMSSGTTYHVWVHYKNDGTADVGFSTDGTRPTSGDNYKDVSGGSATGTPDSVQVGIANGMGTSTHTSIYDKIRVSTSSIGDNPS